MSAELAKTEGNSQSFSPGVSVIYNMLLARLLSIFLLEGMQDLIKCLDSLLKKKKRVSVQ